MRRVSSAGSKPSTRIDLPDGQLQEVRSILARHVPDRVVRAFGSRLSGHAKTTSDLDLCCIMGNRPLPPAVLGELRDAFSESALPIKVDVSEWATMTEAFRRIVMDSSVIL